MTVIGGRTDAEAQQKFEDYRKYISHEGALALFSGWTGIDFSQYALSDPIRYIKNDAAQSAVEAFTVGDPAKISTVREIAEYVGIGGPGPVIVGSAERVADEMLSWVDDTGIDGFNLAYAVTPESFMRASSISLTWLYLSCKGAEFTKRHIRKGLCARNSLVPGAFG
jgi:alkanesulfonate monooxygenase SsuD/methylene tetrahydromethanopterin reductase-like flavin-dependent oxidoreductase (luciferase family)